MQRYYILFNRYKKAVCRMSNDKACAIAIRWHAWHARKRENEFRKVVNVVGE